MVAASGVQPALRSLRRPSVAANAALKLVLLGAIAYMFLFSGQPQFEGKSMGLRALLYPIFAFALPAAYLWRRPEAPYPALFDAAWTFTYTFDIVSNDARLYTQISWWDDLIHFVSTFPFMFVILGAILAFERRGSIRLGFRTAALFALALYNAFHAGWETWEHGMDRFAGTNLQPGGMAEASENGISALSPRSWPSLWSGGGSDATEGSRARWWSRRGASWTRFGRRVAGMRGEAQRHAGER
jgi:hypothetical protein